jgi:hypothetical protein
MSKNYSTIANLIKKAQKSASWLKIKVQKYAYSKKSL